jgi:asparagine synthase (glutamine-hydrolysing)
MCGIVGALNYRDDRRIELRVAQRMLGAVRHRGPDQFGVYSFADGPHRCMLGSARLSIIDLAGGQQPISNEDGTLSLVCNGEIYNHPELRADLERKGHRFSCMSDSEVILHLFEERGPDCLDSLNGQFALALWDEVAKRLFLARDRCGVRPLFYTMVGGALVFASEIKALLAFPGVTAAFDLDTLDEIFTFWSPLESKTAFAEIRSLPPGCWLLAAPDSPVQVKRYWQLSFPRSGAEELDDVDEAAEQLQELLLDAVQLRLRSDVPVGAYLSGGLDSSAIAALVCRGFQNRLESFSIEFSDSDFDESGYQNRMARFLGTRHHRVACSHADIGCAFPRVIWHTEVPILRTAPAPLFLLSKLVQDSGFKVVLTGEGADEFFAGYDIFKENAIRRFWARQPNSSWRPSLLGRLYPYLGRLQTVGSAYQQHFFGRELLTTDDRAYSHAVRWKNTARTSRVFSEHVRAALEAKSRGLRPDFIAKCDLPNDFAGWSSLAQAQYLEATIFLPEYLLSSQGDRMSMAHSVEGRFPFLDHRVIDFCSRLAPRLKLFGLREKFLLKRIMRGVLPDEIVDRPKNPFRAPVQACFFPGGKPLPWVADALSPAAVRKAGIFAPDRVAILAKRSQDSRPLTEMDGMALTAVLSTQLVHQLFIANLRLPAPVDENDNIKSVIHTRNSAEGDASPKCRGTSVTTTF